MLLPREPGDDFQGICPFHGGCWEGLCSGLALVQRTGLPAEEIPPEHPVWDLETQYIAQAIANITCILSPARVILGGSVRKGGQLGEDRFFHKVREKLQAVLNGHLAARAFGPEIDTYLVPPLLEDDAGICGAIALGQRMLG